MDRFLGVGEFLVLLARRSFLSSPFFKRSRTPRNDAANDLLHVQGGTTLELRNDDPEIGERRNFSKSLHWCFPAALVAGEPAHFGPREGAQPKLNEERDARTRRAHHDDWHCLVWRDRAATQSCSWTSKENIQNAQTAKVYVRLAPVSARGRRRLVAVVQGGTYSGASDSLSNFAPFASAVIDQNALSVWLNQSALPTSLHSRLGRQEVHPKVEAQVQALF